MLEYLLEIRRRSLYVLASFVGLFVLFYLAYAQLFEIVLRPLLKSMTADSSLITTSVTGPVFAQIKIAFDFALLAVFPVIFYHLWRFISPALQKNELRGVVSILLYSFLLFIVGILFSYFWVLPYIFQFLLGVVPIGVKLLPDISYAIDFITRMLLIFGIGFQLPLLMTTLVKLQIVDIATFSVYRPYFIVFAFVVGMVFTPPDVFSQIMLALPLVCLYELSILIAKRIK